MTTTLVRWVVVVSCLSSYDRDMTSEHRFLFQRGFAELPSLCEKTQEVGGVGGDDRRRCRGGLLDVMMASSAVFCLS